MMTKTYFLVAAFFMSLSATEAFAAESQRIDGDPGFGSAAAADSDLLAISAPRAVHVYSRDNGGVWREIDEVSPAEGEPGDRFGMALDIDDDIIIASASRAMVNGLENAGAVYVFSREADGTWRQSARVVADEPIQDGHFGSSIGLDAGRLIASAVTSTENGDGTRRVAFVYEHDEATLSWNRVATLHRDGIDGFANSVDISGDRAVVGSHDGFAFTYINDGSGWPMSLPARPTQLGLGMKLKIEDDVLAVTAPQANIPDRPWNAGQLYIFERETNAWEHVATFESPNPVANGGFGTVLDMKDGLIATAGNHETGGILSLIRKDETGEWVRFATLNCCFPEIDRTVAVSAQAVAAGGVMEEYSGISVFDPAELIAESDDGDTNDDDDNGGNDSGGGDDGNNGNGGDEDGSVDDGDGQGAAGDGDADEGDTGDGTADGGDDSGNDDASGGGGSGDAPGGNAETPPADDGGGGLGGLIALLLGLSGTRLARSRQV